ncbi:MAG: MmgE/PrpD family protein [Betaproteobacteria bacterium]|nr:MmgE/PrpD family protein [Betaproteobacteria bacterium]
MGFTKTLAQWIAGVEYESLPPEVTPWVKAAVTDYLAVALAGCPSQGIEIVKRHVLAEYARGKGTLIGEPERVSAEGAALFNGTLSHWEEYDDATYGMSGHPSVVIMPALFAAAEIFGAAGRDFVTAYAAGVEVCAKVGRLVNPQSIVLGYHPTAILGTLGAAAAVAKICKLDARQTETALGIAASHSSGLRPHMGSMVKPLHAGLASRGGLAAAMLAREGFVGAENLIEGKHGFANAFSGGKPGDFEALAARIGKPLEILDPGIAFKIFPSNFHTQAGVVAVLQMAKAEGVKPAEVESIRCLANHMIQHSLWNANPRTGLEGKLSLHFCIAAALVDGQLEVEQFRDERVRDPLIRELMGRLTIEPHPAMAKLDFTKGRDFLGMEVIIKLKSGRTVSRHITSGFSVPALDGARLHPELIAKFVRNAKRVLPDRRIDECIDRIERLDASSAMADFLEPLRHDRRAQRNS